MISQKVEAAYLREVLSSTSRIVQQAMSKQIGFSKHWINKPIILSKQWAEMVTTTEIRKYKVIFCARMICNNYDYINTRGIDLVKSLKLQAIREHRDYFLCVLMFKCIHGLAPHYLSNDVTMVVDIHGYDTRSSENMDLYVPRCTKELCKRSFLYTGSMLWNDLPDVLKESSSLDVFKSNYRFIIGWQSLSIYG